MRQRNIFCGRKAGATIFGHFHALPPYSVLKADELERQSIKKQAQKARAEARKKEEKDL